MEGPGGSPIPTEIRTARARRARASLARLDQSGAGASACPRPGQDKVWRHGTSLFGDLKYPAGFKQFDYVNAKAPKGGTVRQIALGTFDNFNPVIADVKGSLAAGIDLIYETLAVRSLDEVSSEYGLLAEAVSFPADFSSVTYRLRPEAKWHDGTPVTPDDVIFSFEAFKKNSPSKIAYYRHVTKVEKTGDREVTFTFDAPGNRELPQIIGQLTVLPKAWWQGTDKDGKQRDIGATTLEPPLGSGPYRIKDFTPARNIVYERVKDYWGKDLNVNVGINNFDELHYEYFRDIDRRARSLQGRYGRLAHREQRQELGHGLRLPGGRRQARVARGDFRSATSASCRPSPSTSAARNSRIRGCGSPSITRSISRK